MEQLDKSLVWLIHTLINKALSTARIIALNSTKWQNDCLSSRDGNISHTSYFLPDTGTEQQHISTWNMI
jgi:hypothetical protein